MLGGAWPQTARTAPDWPVLQAMAKAHRLEPLLSWQAERAHWPLPPAVSAAWNDARRSAALAGLTQQAALRLALQQLEQAGIEAVALKGVALIARDYPEPALRPMRDIDLLVPETRAVEAAAILDAAGFHAAASDPATLTEALRDDHQLPAQDHRALGVTIELHHRLSDPPASRGYRVPQLDPAAVMARAQPLEFGGVAVFCPSPNDLAAHLIVHAVYGHRLDCGPLVLADLSALAKSGAVAWPELRRAARDGGWLRGADLLIALTDRWFGVTGVAHDPPPPGVLDAAGEALLADPATRGLGELRADLSAAGTGASRVRMLVRRLSPTREVAEREAGGAGPLFWPVWAVRRTWRLVRGLANRTARDDARHALAVMRWVQQ